MAALPAQVEPLVAPHVRGSREQGVPTILVACFLLSLFGVGVGVVIFFIPVMVLAGILAALFWGMILAVRARDHRAWRAARALGIDVGPDPAEAAVEDETEIGPDVAETVIVGERAGLRIGLIIFVVLAVPTIIFAVVLGAVFLGWQGIGLGALLLLPMMIFMGAPIWAAAVEDEIDDAEEAIGVDMRSIR